MQRVVFHCPLLLSATIPTQAMTALHECANCSFFSATGCALGGPPLLLGGRAVSPKPPWRPLSVKHCACYKEVAQRQTHETARANRNPPRSMPSTGILRNSCTVAQSAIGSYVVHLDWGKRYERFMEVFIQYGAVVALRALIGRRIAISIGGAASGAGSKRGTNQQIKFSI